MLQQAKDRQAAALAEIAKQNAVRKRRVRGDEEDNEEILRKPEDILDDYKFSGQTAFMVNFVPLRCKDDKTEVTEEVLREWMIYAIIEEDVHAQGFLKQIKAIDRKMVEIDNNLKKVSKMKFVDAEGKLKKEDEQRAERMKLYDEYGVLRTNAENQVRNCRDLLKAHMDWRRKQQGIEFTKGDVDQISQTCSWKVRIFNTNDAEEMEDLLIRKENWPGINLAAGDRSQDPPLPPWAGRAPVPDGSKEFLPDYRNLEVAIGGARFMRYPQGIGFITKLDRRSANIAAREFGVFYGDFELGEKNGFGIDITDIGVFTGRHGDGYRRGHGRMDYSNGITLVGNFGLSNGNKHVVRAAKTFDNPYLEGEPTGQVEINFGDGGYYKGYMRDGRITGQGDYQSALNEVYSGNFVDGILHGPGGFMMTHAGDSYSGTFEHGQLHGKGFFENKRGDTYDGHWDHQMRHGRGVARLANSACYRGYYVNDWKHGKGSIEYGKKKTKPPEIPTENEDNHQNSPSQNSTPKKSTSPSKDSASKSPKTPNSNEEQINTDLSEFKNIFMGYFMTNEVSNKGCMMDTHIQVPAIISKLNRRSIFPITKVLESENKYRLKANRINEKYADMDMHIRDEISRKKIKMFNQQKHLTKKTIYRKDVYDENVRPHELTSKLELRRGRLGGISEESHMFKKAVVPRLRIANTKPGDYMTRAYRSIRPDDNEVNPGERIDDIAVRVVLSDFEEAFERQRFLKYDMIWQRAENAVANNNRSKAAANN